MGRPPSFTPFPLERYRHQELVLRGGAYYLASLAVEHPEVEEQQGARWIQLQAPAKGDQGAGVVGDGWAA